VTPDAAKQERPRGKSARAFRKEVEHETGFEPATSTLVTFAETPKSLRIPARKPQGANPSRSNAPAWARSGHAAFVLPGRPQSSERPAK
jgi:hypothetical protein